MSISISSAVPSAPVAAQSSSAETAAAPRSPSTAGGNEDVVNLSANQQIHQLHQQGQRVDQIAFSLNLTVEAVNSYLGITNTTG